jgi:hypothetical protein
MLGFHIGEPEKHLVIHAEAARRTVYLSKKGGFVA